MKNICRRFILHNNFIPPKEENKSWDYLAYGYIDGISVKNNLFLNSDCDFNLLWKESIKTKEDLLNKNIMQVIYGFRSEDDQEKNKEEVFWNDRGNKTNFPFFFFIMIQFEDQGRKNLSKLLENKELVEEKFNLDNKVKGIIYLTLENSDLLLVLRSSNYKSGAEIVDRIHRGEAFYSMQDKVWEVKYSFTVPAIDKFYLNDPKRKKLDGNNVYQASIFATESNSGSLDPLYNSLKDKLSPYVKQKLSVLGYNDEVIFLSEIPWDMFLDLYKDQTGILSHSKNNQQYFSSLTTIIGLEQESFKRERTKSFSYRKNKRLQIKQEFFAFLEKKLRELSKDKITNNNIHQNMLLSLYSLANPLFKFENSFISENLFFPSALSILLLIDILYEIFNQKNSDKKLDCYRDYSRFLNGLHAYAQNPIRSDRQFTQAIDFNVRTYNLPIKLNTFYNAFIFYVRDFLNGTENEHRYEFLICPGVSSGMDVEELFRGQSEDKRLFLVNIPENQGYRLELMMIMLCHEIGHFVGSNIRKRNYRRICLIHSLARMITLFYRKNIFELSGDNYDEFWKVFEKKLAEDMEENYELYYNKIGIQKQFIKAANDSMEKYEQDSLQTAKFREQFRDRSLILKDGLFDASINIIRNKWNNLFSSGLYQYYMEIYEHCNEKKDAVNACQEIKIKISEASMDILRGRGNYKNLVSIETMLDILMTICKEGLSDIIAIMTLKLDKRQYVMALIENIYEQGNESILTEKNVNEMIIRASLVFICMIKQSRKYDLSYSWSPEWNVLEEKDERVKKFYNKIEVFIEQYIKCNNYKIWKKEDANEMVCNYLCNSELLKNILKYLFKCRECYSSLIQQSLEKKDKQKNIIKIFKISQLSSVDSIMLEIQKIIDKYHDDIHKKMIQIVKDSSLKKEKCNE